MNIKSYTLERSFLKAFTVSEEQAREERNRLRAIAQRMSRITIAEEVKKEGLPRVFRILAATVLDNPAEYDAAALDVARQVPLLRPGRDWESYFLSNMHPVYIQGFLMEYARLRQQLRRGDMEKPQGIQRKQNKKEVIQNEDYSLTGPRFPQRERDRQHAGSHTVRSGRLF